MTKLDDRKEAIKKITKDIALNNKIHQAQVLSSVIKKWMRHEALEKGDTRKFNNLRRG